MNAETTFDVAIVGGGVSALAAAAHLSKVGMRWVLLEARSRLGGRVWSSEKGAELGAEFVHGRHAKTWDYLSQANIDATRYPERNGGKRLYAFDNQLITDDTFGREVERLFTKIEAYKGLDISIDEFVQTLATKDRTALFSRLIASRVWKAQTLASSPPKRWALSGDLIHQVGRIFALVEATRAWSIGFVPKMATFASTRPSPG